MKHVVIALLAFLYFQFSFGQKINSIRVNNSIKGQSWSYSISDIDSIIFDRLSQYQKIYIDGNCKIANIGSVDSITFSTDEAINVVENLHYVENSKSYIFTNGIIVVEREDSVHGKIIIVDSLDVNKSRWSEDKRFMIYCDSRYQPFVAANSKYIYYFEYNDKGELIDVNATTFNSDEAFPSQGLARKITAHRASTLGWTTSDDISATLELYDYCSTALDPSVRNIASSAASVLAKFLPEGIPQDLAELAPSLIEALNGGKIGMLGAVFGYIKLIRSIGENRARNLIGDCTPYILSAKRKGSNSAMINLKIENVTSTSPDIPYYVLKYWQEVNGDKANVIYFTSPQKATNGTHTVEINNLNGGRYGFQVLIFPSIFIEHENLINLYNFCSNVGFVDIPRLYFKELEQYYTTYVNDNVCVSFKAILEYPSEQDKVILSYFDSSGLYVSYKGNSNQREDFYSIKENDGTEFYINFDIPKNEFIFDYNNLIANCTSIITFKTYSVDGWGIKEFYDEKQLKIIYDIKPTLSTGNIIKTEKNSAIVNCNYENFSFWSGVCGVEYWSDENHLEKTIEVREDGVVEVELTDLTPGTTYFYRAFIKIGDEYIRAKETESFTTKQEQPQVHLCPDDHHPHQIVLGLPSGTKWSCCNVGASKPEEYGGYYTVGEPNEKDEYSWENYPYRDVDLGKDISGTEYDVAHVLLGDDWKTPTKEQFEELIKYTTFTPIIKDGVWGALLTGSEGSIFLPAPGYKLAIIYDDNGNIIKKHYHEGERGTYWSSTQYAHREGDTDSMYEMYFSREDDPAIQPPSIDAANNFWGMPIRPVSK